MSATTAFEHVNLIDGTGRPPLRGVTVLVKEGRISTIGPDGSFPIPEGSRRVDLNGKWLLPGLINGNVHLTDSVLMMGPGGIEYLARHEHQLEEVIIEASQIALRSGVTTVFDTHNAVGPVLRARDQVQNGQAIGARIFAAGNIVGMGGPFSADFFYAARHAASPTFVNRINTEWEAGVGHQLSRLPEAEVRARVRDYLDRGVDMLKIAVSDHMYASVGLDRTYLTFHEPVLRGIFEEARAKGVPILTHTTSIHALDLATKLSADVLIHATITRLQAIPHNTIDEILEKGIACGVQSVTSKYQAHLQSTGSPLAQYGGSEHAANERLLIDAGANIFMSTDAGCTSHDLITDLGPAGCDERPWTLGTDHFDWATAMTEKGLDAMGVILASTANVAKAYGQFDDFGSVEVGKLADFLIVNSSPLENIDNLRSIDSVYQAGVWVDREALPTNPLVTAVV